MSDRRRLPPVPGRNPPTTAMPAVSAESATTAAPPVPAPAHFWRQKVPAHIGRARTSTLVLAALFVVFATLYLLVRPAVEYTTVETTSGQTVRVPVSELAPTTEPPAPAPTSEPTEVPTEAPTPSPPAEEETTGTDEEEPTGTDEEQPTDEATTTRPPATTEAPATTEEPAPSPEPEVTPAPTS